MREIRYCGNCNPDEDPEEVKKALEKLFPGADGPCIIVNGCSRACLSKRTPGVNNDPGVIVMSSREVMRRMRK